MYVTRRASRFLLPWFGGVCVVRTTVDEQHKMVSPSSPLFRRRRWWGCNQHQHHTATGMIQVTLTILLILACMIQLILVSRLSSLTTTHVSSSSTESSSKVQSQLRGDTDSHINENSVDGRTESNIRSEQLQQVNKKDEGRHRQSMHMHLHEELREQPPQMHVLQQQLHSTARQYTRPVRKWAYVFLLAGVDPDKPSYRGFLYNILVASYNLRQASSASSSSTPASSSSTTTDFIVMIQMDYKSTADTLPLKEEQMLRSLFDNDSHNRTNNSNTIQLQYLPKPKDRKSTFYTLQYEKFRILNMTQYSRVMYLDSDIMPLCNLDYLFDLSEPATTPAESSNNSNSNMRLQPNVVVAWWNEPASGGIFILEPGLGKYDTIRSLIEQQEISVAQENDFDETIGWGHVHDIESNDTWSTTPHWPSITTTTNYTTTRASTSISAQKITTTTTTTKFDEIKGITSGTLWRWPGSFADQGLLYYWTKYQQQSVSILNIDKMEHYWQSEASSRSNKLIHTRIDNPSIFQQLDKKSCLPPNMDLTGSYGSSMHPMFVNRVPYRDFVHFTLNLKPWINDPKAETTTTEVASTTTASQNNETNEANSNDDPNHAIQSSLGYWYHILLNVLHDKVHLTQNDMDDLLFLGDPPLGQYPKITDMIRAGRDRLRRQRGAGNADPRRRRDEPQQQRQDRPRHLHPNRPA